MQVKYIWIKEYKNLKEIGFNLNSGSNETYEYIKGELKITENKTKFPDDFYSKNIKSVTAIVGKNGSGKTNFSEFLNYNLAHARNGGLSTYIHSQGIIVLEDKIFIQNDLSLLNESELKHSGYNVLRFKDAPLDWGNGEFHWYKMEKNKYIYYNPNFDFRSLPMRSGSDNIINISTNYLTWNDVYNSSKHKIAYSNTYFNNNERITDSLMAYYRNEKLRESDLIINYSEIKNLISRIPHILKITIDHQSENNLLNQELSKNDDEGPLAKKREANKSFLVDKYRYISRESRFLQFKITEKDQSRYDIYDLSNEVKAEIFETLFFLNFIDIYLYLNSEVSFSEEFLLFLLYNNDNKFFDGQVKDIIDLKDVFGDLLPYLRWDNSIGKVKNYSTNYKKREIDFLNLFRQASVDTSNRIAKDALNKVVNKTRQLLNGELHYHYQFNHLLSSGEQNLLNFYSRFYWAKEQVLENERDDYGIKGDRIVIFIDEGEIALHPEWQRKYFDLMIKFLSDLFKDREIQLILTTHSPFVLSDIPKEHIIFLRQNDETGNAEIANVNRDKTFGANIYTLLSDSFFMEEGTIGDFAKQKIEEALRILIESPKLSDLDNDRVKTIIDLIGEPLIKMQLERLHNDKLEEPIIREMQKRIDELEANQNKRSDDQD